MITDMAKKLRIVLDTNVIVSAIIFNGKPRAIYDFVLNERYRTITSSTLISELTGILIKKFSFSLAEINLIEYQIREIFEVVHPKESINEVRDVDDNRVLEAAIAGKCQYIITGDRDLLDLKSYHQIKILTPSDFLELLDRKQK